MFQRAFPNSTAPPTAIDSAISDLRRSLSNSATDTLGATGIGATTGRSALDPHGAVSDSLGQLLISGSAGTPNRSRVRRYETAGNVVISASPQRPLQFGLIGSRPSGTASMPPQNAAFLGNRAVSRISSGGFTGQTAPTASSGAGTQSDPRSRSPNSGSQHLDHFGASRRSIAHFFGFGATSEASADGPLLAQSDATNGHPGDLLRAAAGSPAEGQNDLPVVGSGLPISKHGTPGAAAEDDRMVPGTQSNSSSPLTPPSDIKAEAPSLKNLLGMAESAMQAREFPRAVDELEMAEKLAANKPAVWIDLVNAELGAARYIQAGSHLKRTFSREPALFDVRYDVLALFGDGRLKAIVKDLEESASKDLRSPTPLFLLAYISHSRGDTRGAANYLDAADARSGGTEPAYRLLRERWAFPDKAKSLGSGIKQDQ